MKQHYQITQKLCFEAYKNSTKYLCLLFQELLATVHHIGRVTENIENNLPARYSLEDAVGTGKVRTL
jgi:hypothetical protein